MRVKIGNQQRTVWAESGEKVGGKGREEAWGGENGWSGMKDREETPKECWFICRREWKKAKAEGKKCHTKNMWHQKKPMKLIWKTPHMCRLGRAPRRKNAKSGVARLECLPIFFKKEKRKRVFVFRVEEELRTRLQTSNEQRTVRSLLSYDIWCGFGSDLGLLSLTELDLIWVRY